MRYRPLGNLSDKAYPRTKATIAARVACPDGKEPSVPITKVSWPIAYGNFEPKNSRSGRGLSITYPLKYPEASVPITVHSNRVIPILRVLRMMASIMLKSRIDVTLPTSVMPHMKRSTAGSLQPTENTVELTYQSPK